MNVYSILGIIAGICTSAAALPQLIKAFKTKKTTALSPTMFAVLIVGFALWIAYGALKSDWPIIITNGISLLLNGAVLVLFFVHRKH